MTTMTYFGIFSPALTLEGAVGSAFDFHDFTRESFSGLVERQVQFIYDYLLLEQHEKDLLDELYNIFEVCK